MATEQKTGETQPAAKGKKINSGEIGGITVAKSENNADIPTALFIEDVDKFFCFLGKYFLVHENFFRSWVRRS